MPAPPALHGRVRRTPYRRCLASQAAAQRSAVSLCDALELILLLDCKGVGAALGGVDNLVGLHYRRCSKVDNELDSDQEKSIMFNSGQEKSTINTHVAIY